jgi:hypothetical protein
MAGEASERQLPGFGTTAEPPDAPDSLQDRHSYADQRLAGMWGAQEYYGPKPGRQTGSLVSTADRDIRKPLPTMPPVGGMSGPANSHGFSIGAGGLWTGPALFPEPYAPYPSWGPKPGLPNCDADEDQAAGRPHRRIPAVQGEEMNSGARVPMPQENPGGNRQHGRRRGPTATIVTPRDDSALEDAAKDRTHGWTTCSSVRDRVYDEGEPDCLVKRSGTLSCL